MQVLLSGHSLTIEELDGTFRLNLLNIRLDQISGWELTVEIYNVFDLSYLTPPVPYFLPSPFLTCCEILPTSFGGKGPHLRR